MVYIIQFGTQDLYKIGYTQGHSKKKASKRMASLQTGAPLKLSLHSYIQYVGLDVEKVLHKSLDNHKISGEWFLLSEHQLLTALENVDRMYPKAKLRKVQTLQKVSLEKDITMTRTKTYQTKKPIKKRSFLKKLSHAWQEVKFAFFDGLNETEYK